MTANKRSVWTSYVSSQSESDGHDGETEWEMSGGKAAELVESWKGRGNQDAESGDTLTDSGDKNE